MPKSSPASVRTLCRKRIAALKIKKDDPKRFEDRVVRSTKENIASGRFQRVAASSPKALHSKLADYVDRVIYFANQEEARLDSLERAEPAEWNRLREVLFRRSVTMARRFRREANAPDEAFDFAQDACLIIFDKHYPCDVSFEAWATTILKHLVLAHYTRTGDVLSRPLPPDSLDEPRRANSENSESLGEWLANPNSLAPFEQVENQILLLNAIEQLRSSTQRRVILESYLEGQSNAEIAKHLHKTKQAIYNLHKRALARLKKIMTEPSRVKKTTAESSRKKKTTAGSSRKKEPRKPIK